MSPAAIHIGAKTSAKEEEVKEQEKKAFVEEAPKPTGLMDKINDYLANLTPIKNEDKVSFFRLLATMINAGISIVKSLKILKGQTENPHFKKIIADLAYKIESGKSFSESLATYSEYFTDAQVGMVESGEASGRLNQTLLQIAQETEKSAALTSKIKGAMIYPITVILIMMGAGFAIMTFVMPKIKDMFENMGADLPGMTVAMIKMSDFLVGKTMGLPNALVVVITFVALVFTFLWWKKTKLGRYLWAEAVLHFPVFGKMTKKVALARFCRGLSTMISSGISIIKALRITAASVGNPVYEKRINQIADDVKQGIPMGENMKDDEKHFPTMVVGMISVAEQTAQVDTITEKLADFYEDEVNDTVKNLSALMEPIIIVILGVSVAFLVMAVMLPILQSSDLASQSA